MSTTKRPSDLDGNQVLQHSYNDADASMTVNGFVVGKVGHRVTLTLATTTLANDTEVYNFFDGTDPLYEITIIYTDGSRDLLLSVERTA